MRFLPLLALFALACETESTDSGNGTLDPNDNGDDSCKGTAPVIDSFEAKDEGKTTVDGDSGNEYPIIDLIVEYSDEDGDAHVLSADIWWDDEVDGTVDITTKVDSAVARTSAQDADGNPVEECAGKAGGFDIGQAVAGGTLKYDTEYDFAIVVYDNADMASAPAFATAITPAELATE